MKMPSRLLIGLMITTMSITAQAGELYTPEQYLVPSVSTKTRAEVKAETLRAIKAGEIAFGDVDNLPHEMAAVGGKTRAEVKAEAIQAIAAHVIPTGEFDYPHITTLPSTKTRAEVRAELFADRKLRALSHEPSIYTN